MFLFQYTNTANRGDKFQLLRLIPIAGFDAWAVKKQWWIDNGQLFKDEYVYAEHLWDVFFTLTMFNNSKCMLCNKENYIIHEKHDLNWNETSPEAIHNSNLWSKSVKF